MRLIFGNFKTGGLDITVKNSSSEQPSDVTKLAKVYFRAARGASVMTAGPVYVKLVAVEATFPA